MFIEVRVSDIDMDPNSTTSFPSQAEHLRYAMESVQETQPPQAQQETPKKKLSSNIVGKKFNIVTVM